MISTAELVAITSLERISQSLLNELEYGIQVIESRTVTIVVQIRNVSDLQFPSLFPGVTNSTTESGNQFSIPLSVIQQLSIDGKIAVCVKYFIAINPDSVEVYLGDPN